MTSTAPATTPTEHARPGESAGRLAYVPALDGIRGIFIWVELLVHAGYGGILPSGFLVISMFFTISGYLITSLLIGEHAKTGRISLKNFWTRRFRRLMPAALLALAVIVVAGAIFPLWSEHYFSGDVFGTLAYVANWRFVLTNRTYALAFNTAPSPVQHFWSLAIEEQVYLTLPLVFMGTMWARRFWKPAPFAVFGAITAVSVYLSVHFYSPSNWSRSYYGTDTRVAEVLVGVLLAFVTASGGYRRFLDGERGKRTIAVVGSVGIVLMVWLWTRGTIDGPFVYKGGFVLNAVFTCMTVLGCTVRGPVEWLLRKRVLVYLGKVTYGIYLVQWPLFLVLTRHHVFPNRPLTFVCGSALSILLAGLSFRFVESPVRLGKLVKPPRMAVAAPVAIALVAIATVVLPLRVQKTNTIDLSGLGSGGGDRNAAHRVAIMGDSMSWTMGIGLSRWGSPPTFSVKSLVGGGCGIGVGGEVSYLQVTQDPPPACGPYVPGAPKSVDDFAPQVVVVMASGTDLSDHRFGSGPWEHIGQPAYDRWLLGQYDRLLRTYAAPGRTFVLVTEPKVDIPVHRPDTGPGPFPEAQPARLEALNALMRRVVATHPGTHLIDLAAYARDRPGGPLDPAFRADGVHFTKSGADEVARWMGPKLLALMPR